jgi:IS6 family transposase
MLEFKWRQCEGEIILWAVRWYCRYGISYRDLEQMMGERGVLLDHSTIYRWVQRYAPKIEKRLRRQWRRPQSTSWRVDETYVKVRGQWAYLDRALDKHGNTIDFYLSPTPNAKAAKRFLGKALNGLKAWEKPEIINTDKAPTYGIAIAELKAESKCPEKTVHRQVKYLNNVIESDHGKLKQLIRPVRGFKTLKTAYATIAGFEVMRALRKGQAAIFNLTCDIHGEARILERAFSLGPSALAETIALLGEKISLQTAYAPRNGALREILKFATEPTQQVSQAENSRTLVLRVGAGCVGPDLRFALRDEIGDRVPFPRTAGGEE